MKTLSILKRKPKGRAVLAFYVLELGDGSRKQGGF